jgi:hypothetical protein|tara:strand:- start:667 stop:843 length:177 start_codon:yes stop_codon:yes gene_type:complete
MNNYGRLEAIEKQIEVLNRVIGILISVIERQGGSEELVENARQTAAICLTSILAEVRA